MLRLNLFRSAISYQPKLRCFNTSNKLFKNINKIDNVNTKQFKVLDRYEVTIKDDSKRIDNEEPIKANEEPIKANEEPIKNNEEPTKNNEELTKNNEELTKNIEEPTKNNEELTKNNEELTKNIEELTKNNIFEIKIMTLLVVYCMSLVLESSLISSAIIAALL